MLQASVCGSSISGGCIGVGPTRSGLIGCGPSVADQP
jgi:hypothetical protein